MLGPALTRTRTLDPNPNPDPKPDPNPNPNPNPNANPDPNPNPYPNPYPNQVLGLGGGLNVLELGGGLAMDPHGFGMGGGAAAQSKCSSWQRPSSAPVPFRARLVALAGSTHSQGEPGPLGAQPMPRVLELAASKAADSTAFDHPGAGGSPLRGLGGSSNPAGSAR